ncbi:bifunctional dihydroflavonol 4-reductase/flavanone 4-reductase protein [Dioscorea alata]|uniref:Bifunctional dihydroflavonol 4-reductase/flavanone 4-reductase protein n=2 Tax=Dioscorea alata TaxID=55571 RepID=A0ACB7TR52_DIOAL|nr:bifunctional dihydroflavonol 4-reductase/flavanone 4-reductase protein [Dioscorea alata]
MAAEKGTVCVTGASGFIGSWLTMQLLQQGYSVNATVRDPKNMTKVKHLLELPGADERLTLYKADLSDEGSFDEAINGCVGVFHVATPMDLQVKDHENELIKPTIEGVVNLLKSCLKSKTVKRVVYTSTAGTCNMQPIRKSVYDETSWTDTEFCKTVKMTAWTYFYAKTIAEKTAFEFAENNGLDLISVIPTLVNGPFLMSTMPPSMLTALALITRNVPFYYILNPIQFVHLDDLCRAHVFLFEHPEAKGRYICSSHDITITELADLLRKKYPEYKIPTEFEGIDKVNDVIKFSSKKLRDLGFEFKYSVEDMYDGVFQSCKEKGLLPPLPKKI